MSELANSTPRGAVAPTLEQTLTQAPAFSPEALRALMPVACDLLAALALGACPRTPTWLHAVLADPALRSGDAKLPRPEEIRTVLRYLKAEHWAQEDHRRPGLWFLNPGACGVIYDDLLSRLPAQALRDALAHADDYSSIYLPQRGFGRFPSAVAVIARLRLDAYTGMEPAELDRVLDRLPWGVQDAASVLDAAVAACVDERLIDRLHPALQADLLAQGVVRLAKTFHTGIALTPAQVRARAFSFIAARDSQPARALRWVLAVDRLVADGQSDRTVEWAASFDALLAPAMAAPLDEPLPSVFASLPRGRDETGAMAVRGAYAQAIGAAAAAAAGQWSLAESEFELSQAVLRKVTGKRRGLWPETLALPYVWCLLAQQSATHVEKALKFCLAEGGKREPALDSPFGIIARAIQMRLGIAARELKFFAPAASHWGVQAVSARPACLLDHPRWLMRAWLKDGSYGESLSAGEIEAARQLADSLDSAGLGLWCDQLNAALRVLNGEASPPWFFVPAGQERWQVALAALHAVAAPTAAAGLSASAQSSRLVWLIEDGPHGGVLSIGVYEQTQGLRGWGKRKDVPLARLQRGVQTLAPHDARVVHAIRQESLGRGLCLDLAQAAAALVGHPCVAFVEAPDVFIDLAEAEPELDIVEERDHLRVRLQPPLQVANDAAVARWAGSEAEQKALDALRLISIWRDGPQRARLICLSAAQKRVAQLLSANGLEVPRQGAAQLQEVLISLGSHFRIHADDAQTAQAAREVGAESRLRAELQPVGQGLQLRLVAAPFGADFAVAGPRLIPGRGRARVVAVLNGESVGVQRDLERERAHLHTVLDACPLLLEPAPDAPCEWLLEAADEALGLLERLQPLAAVAAFDWPQGRPVRVTSAAIEQLSLKVKTRQNWLALQGELRVDEELVIGLQQLISFASQGRSRFIPLGDGRFLALTQELRERVADIAAVADFHAARGQSLSELRMPSMAAPWLEAATAGARVEPDAAYVARLQALDEARRIVPALPKTLQAELRPYQEEGFEWAMRLASAGMGACLADDMGLGKTLQALAVLLARAGNGPALVVVPTSLLGNWRAEALRFAPTLNVHLYGEQGGAAQRVHRLAEMGRQDVLLISYPMLQIDAESFADEFDHKQWATVVLDEAQAIKNAAAKRSQAVFALKADFRLVMSGTPIENRLSELWSVMHACNPGLLGSQKRFNERFANLIERQSDRVAQRTLKRLIAPFILRRTKAQVLADLPPRTELVLRVRGDDAERAHYEALRREALLAAEKSLAGESAGQAHLNILAGLTRLRRAACDPRLITPTLKHPGAKVQAFTELVVELVANGHKALVFSQFVDFLQLLREPLDAAAIAYQYLDGSTPAAERTRRVDAFQNGDGHLFLISLKAGGFGLNLTVADFVVIADPWWNPAAEDQASGRAHRIGQHRPVTVYRLVHEGTLEERILTLHQTKRELADNVLAGEDGGAVSMPMASELLALMRDQEEAHGAQ